MADSYDNLRSTTVIELPVLQIVRDALLSPFLYLAEFVKFGGITILLGLGARIILWLISQAGAPPLLYTAPLVVTNIVIATPFVVTWTRLIIDGRAAVVGRPVFQYGKCERRYILASGSIFIVAVLIVVGQVALLAYAQRTYDRQLIFEAAVLVFVFLVILFIVSIRISFLFPALATDTYVSLATSWRQTRGQFERLLAIEAMAYAPFLVIIDILIRATRDQGSAAVLIIRWVVESFNATLGWAALAAAMALAYKSIVPILREKSPAASRDTTTSS